MGSRLPQPNSSAPPAVITPLKLFSSLQADNDQYASGPYGSPISGLCTGSAALPAASAAKTKLNMTAASAARPKAGQPQQAATGSPALTAGRHVPGVLGPAARTSSMPEPWRPGSWSGRGAPGRQHGADQQQQVQQLRLSADNRPRRDQDLGHSSPGLSRRSSFSGPLDLQHSTAEGSPAQSSHSQSVQQQGLLPLDVLLSPLLPSADEAKLVDRLSQLRHALDEHVRLAAGWEQQAVTLQAALSEAQEASLMLQGQVASQQHNMNLLGGNLQGRLSLVQGSVLAQMQEQVNHKDAALAASAQHVLAIQAELERLSCSYAAKLAAEQLERQRLAAEAAQARLLCTARGRQVASLQQELQQLRDAASQQQQTAAVSTSVQQQQLESLRERLQVAQQQLEAAQFEAEEAQQVAAAAEGGRSCLRQQVEELQALLTEKQLQIEWLEGKVADLEGSDMSQQLRRHQAEVTRLQEASAGECRALEQQLAAAQRQVAQLQQQDHTRQQQLAQLEQQAHQMQQQLAQQEAYAEDLQQQQQQLQEQQQQHTSGAAAELAQQLTAADAELQQLREQFAEAEGEVAALQQQLQQQERQPQAQQHEFSVFAAEQAATGDDDAADEGGDGSGSSPLTPAAAVHALRAELGIANAEVARLRHQLDVASASQQQERELTGHEILRLQQELSEAAGSGSGGAAAEEVMSRLGTNRIGSDSSSSWHSVHDNPAFEHGGRQQQQQQQDSHALLGEPCDEEAGNEDEHLQQMTTIGQYNSQAVVLPDAPAAARAADVSGVAVSKVSRYDATLQDQAETISSLQRQLKQQEQLLAALQKRERRVFDSAASNGSWAEALGFEDHRQLNLPAARSTHPAAVGPSGSVTEPATPHADAAVQTDLSSPAESAGSTAAVGPTAAGSNDGSAMGMQQQQDQQAISRQQVMAGPGTAAGETVASSALLAAARHEILRLQELNRQLMQAHAEELKVSVSFDDARRAVSEAKQHAKAKAAAMLQASNKAWSDKLAAARAETQLLHEQLQDLQQQRDQLAQQLSSVSHSHQASVHQLQQELSGAQQHSQTLGRQLRDMADSHMQELEQLRMEAEADAAAAMLDAAAAANKLEQQQHKQRSVCDLAAQTEAVAHAVDAAAQTDVLPNSQRAEQHAAQQQQQRHAAVMNSGKAQIQSQMPSAGTQHAAQHPPGEQQQQQDEASTSPSSAERRPGTPQPAAASAAAAAAAAATDAVPNPAQAHASSDLQPAATPQQQRLVSSWRSAAAPGVTAADVGDDDICRFSSASDTPASASSRGPVSRFRGSVYGQGADAGRPGSGGHRPGSAEGTGELPELTATSSPIAPSSIAKPVARQAMQQQQQQANRLQRQQEAQQQQQQQPPEKGSVQMSSWHAELLQQQAELESMRMRLSQQQQPWKSGPTGSSKGSPAVAHSRTLLLAPFGPAIDSTGAVGGAGGGGGGGAATGGVGSPAGPLLSSSSPLTYQQRRAAAVQAAAATAPAPLPLGGAFSADPPLGLAHQGRQMYSQQSGVTAAEQLPYGQQQQQQQQGSAAAGGGGVTGFTRWRSSSSPDGLANSLLMGSPQPYPPSAGGTAAARTGGMAAAASSSWGLSLTAAAGAARRSVSPAGKYNAAAGAPGASPAAGGSSGTAGGSSLLSSSTTGSAAAAAGLSKLGDDVLGALSLSRYHRERSKLQEARAKQHALLATHHEDQAAALRNSRLGEQAAAAGAGLTAAGPAAGVSPHAGSSRAWLGAGGAAGSGLL